MAWIRSKKKNGCYEGGFLNYLGKQQTFKGTGLKSETLKLANDLEEQHRKARLLGIIPGFISMTIEEGLKNYYKWGNSQGGKKNQPWSPQVFKTKKIILEELWIPKLNLKYVSQLEAPTLLKQVEDIKSELWTVGSPLKWRFKKTEKKKHLSNKTVKLYLEPLTTFISYLKRNKIIKENQLENLNKIEHDPVIIKRNFKLMEYLEFREKVSEEHQIIYDVAVMTGLRGKELRKLLITDLIPKIGLKLRGQITKNRNSGIQPLPEELINKILKIRTPDLGDKLIFVPDHQNKMFKKDLKNSGIPEITYEGKLSFHSLRGTFSNWLRDQGVSVLQLLDLMRHSDIKTTEKHYLTGNIEEKQRIVNQLFNNCLKKNEALQAV